MLFSVNAGQPVKANGAKATNACPRGEIELF